MGSYLHLRKMSMNWLKRNDLAVFLFLAFALSWFIWPLVLVNPESVPMIPYGPFIAVFVVLALTRGWAGVRDLLASMARWRVGLRWYAVALLVPIAITVVAIYLTALFGGPSPTAADLAGWYALPLMFLSTTLFNGPFTEEPGAGEVSCCRACRAPTHRWLPACSSGSSGRSGTCRF